MWPVSVLLVLSTVQCMYLYWTTSFLRRILFKIYFWLNEYFQYFIHSKDWLLGRNFHRTKILTTMLIWCLKHVKDFILTFSISGSFFPEKEFLNLCTMILFSFSFGGCANDVVDNRINYQGYKYVYFLQYQTLTVIHFMNGEGAC